jgi:Zn-dependent protease with chaperone function
VARQHELLEEEMAFVMGHEIAHHYLGHTGCVGTPHPLTQIGAMLSTRLPIFNQPFELAADTQGTTNMLNAGARRNPYKWTEGGGLMMLSFFSAFEEISAGDSILFAFVLSHPPSGVRIPIVTQTANNWRAAQPRPPMPPRP